MEMRPREAPNKRPSANANSRKIGKNCEIVMYKFCLLELDFSASSFQLLLHVFSFSLSDAFFHRLRSAFDEVLSFFQAEACARANFLNDVDLVVARVSEHDCEFSLCFSSWCGSSATYSSHSNWGSSRYAELLL